MRRRLTGAARSDIAAILDWSHDRFGPAARRRYERLISRALLEIADSVRPVGSRAAADVGAGIYLYHLRHSRQDPAQTSVNRPRHFLVYRYAAPDLIVVLRVLHDAMHLPAHLNDKVED